MEDDEFDIVARMDRYGGNFVKGLARCFYCADRPNFLKLKAAFPEYWEEYKNFKKPNEQA